MPPRLAQVESQRITEYDIIALAETQKGTRYESNLLYRILMQVAMPVYLASCMYVWMGLYSWAYGVCLIDFNEYVHILSCFYYSTRVLVVLSHFCT